MGMFEDTHPQYNWYQMFSEPADFGYGGTARYRTWVIGAQQDSTTCLSDPFSLYDEVVAGFKDIGVVTEVAD